MGWQNAALSCCGWSHVEVKGLLFFLVVQEPRIVNLVCGALIQIVQSRCRQPLLISPYLLQQLLGNDSIFRSPKRLRPILFLLIKLVVPDSNGI